MGAIGTSELIIILVILVIFFGGARLPKLARSVGEAIRELRHATAIDDDRSSD